MFDQIIIKDLGSLYMHSRGPFPLLRGSEMSKIPVMQNAWINIKDGRIEEYGFMKDGLPDYDVNRTKIIDGSGRFVIPSYIDAHTHLVFAESRENEFVDRIRGLSYQEISERGGGILNSAKKLSDLPEEILFQRALQRIHQVHSCGTGAIEIKSGYGLNTEAELKMLKVIRRLRETTGMPIKSTFLGAHSYPLEFRNNHEGYLREIQDSMLPKIADHGLADYIDVFCESGFYSLEETKAILMAGRSYGLRPRVHTNQFTHSGGIQLSVELEAISVDHLEVLNTEEIDILKNSATLPVLLPHAAFFMNLHYPPARQMIEADLALVIASDFNPGTSPCFDMNRVFGISCAKMRMLPEEVLAAVTINAAYALELESELGSITPRKMANLILSKPGRSLNHIPYYMDASWIEMHMIRGRLNP